ncbi:hypothetical protein PV10_01069 [Exophiala mesophila]|uniref:DUF7492 domain-containing protein n=1 Tax=Exophiala mesophila TaxID=212818 RepID=A0A0D1ZRS6_EXOME|nr:uncharacterized protein PV10_01069 [Exophiala mesophila]KIV97307.1 hypothetical protein PV10_01069 [Exophiala mesophila]
MRSQISFRGTLFGLLAIPRLALTHTWVEQMMVIAPNGTLVGQPGYPRGNVLRGTPAFGDPAMVNLIPPDGRPINVIEPSDLMCKVSQVSQSQTDGSPRLQAAPGAAVALRFQENGHVTLPDGQPGKPPNRGTVFVYGTSQPSRDDSFLAIHRQWTADGSGGDGRGVLLSTRNFDDGQCYQVNGGPLSHQRQTAFPHQFNQYMGNDLWCQQDILLPADIPVGQPYTLYWVWDWPTLPGTPGYPEGKQEIYTTCLDIDIVADSGVEVFNKAQGSSPGYVNQPLDQAAVKAQMDDIANPTAVTGPSIPFSASATGPVAGAASEASAFEATAVTTGDLDFLTVHTASSAGFGVETQTFSVLPIGETSAPQGNGNGGFAFGNGNRGSGNRGNQGPQVTPAPNNNQAGLLTVTEYDPVTETIYQTVYETRYTKRDAAPLVTPAPVVKARSPEAQPEEHSTAHSAFRLRARNPFIWLGWQQDSTATVSSS